MSQKKKTGSSSVKRPQAARSKNGERILRKDVDDMPEVFRDRDISEVISPEKAAVKPLPRWYKILMFTLMVIGLIWIVSYYILQGEGPVASWGAGNIAAGFGFIFVGFIMMLRWR